MTVPTLHQPAGRQGQAPPAPREELDLLRALVAVGLVFFHTAVIWGAGEFPAKAASERQAVTVMLAFGASWGMPLLFLIAGMGAWYSLRSRTPGAFARERLRRLGVPLLAGLLTLVPLQVYLGQRRAGDAGSSTGFLARFWDRLTAMDPSSLGLRLLKSLAGWLWVVAMLGAARARIDRRRGAPAPAPVGRPGLARRLGPYANRPCCPSTCSTRRSSS